MKKIFTVVAILAVAVGVAGCSEDAIIEENNAPLANSQMVTVKAYTGNAETRTNLSDKTADNKFNVLWASEDKIKIGDEEFTLSAGEGTATGTFSGTAPADGEYTVYYPSTYKGATWPDQKYVDATNISGAPMVASTTVSNGEISALSFTNVGGVARYTVKGNKTIKSINIKGNGLDISLDCGNGVQLTEQGTVFNIALPEGSYSNAKLSFITSDGMIATKSATTFKVTRNMVSVATFEAADLNFVPSAYSLPGAKGVIDGREAVVVELLGIGKVAIATENVKVGDKEYFSYDEISNPDFLSDGWYVPSAQELGMLNMLLSLYSQWGDGETGKGRTWGINSSNLFLPAAGYVVDGSVYLANEVGIYASREAKGSCIYSVNFDKNGVSFGNNMTIESTKYSVRPFHNLEGNMPLPTIDYNSPEGTYGMFHGQEAIVVNIGGKLMAMATKNMNADRPSDFGSYYTASEAAEATSYVFDGWRMPTHDELQALRETYPIGSKSEWATQNGVPGWQISFSSGNTLFFPTAGYSESDNIQCEGKEGMYWASRKDVSHDSYLWIGDGHNLMRLLEIENSRKGTVRLIRNIELTSGDLEGAIGYLDGRQAIVANLGGSYGKVAIALQNEGATSITDAGPYYKWTEAINLQADGWYLPSKEEYAALEARYKANLNYGSEGTGATWNIGGNSLFMPYAGCINERGTNPIPTRAFYCWTSSYDIKIGGFGAEKKIPYAFKTELGTSESLSNILIYSADGGEKMNVRFFHKLQ